MSEAKQLPLIMTADEFLSWSAPDGSERWELIDDEPQAMAPSSPRHGAIAAMAARLLADHPHCRVVAEAGVKPDDYNIRIPDLTVSCEPIGPDDLLLREPLVIIEILSPSNAAAIRSAVVRYRSPNIARYSPANRPNSVNPCAIAVRVTSPSRASSAHRTCGCRKSHPVLAPLQRWATLMVG